MTAHAVGDHVQVVVRQQEKAVFVVVTLQTDICLPGELHFHGDSLNRHFPKSVAKATMEHRTNA